MPKFTEIQERTLYSMAPLPVSPFAQRAGYTNQSRYKTDRDRVLSITLGQLELVGLQERYLDSYNETDQPSVLQYRDLMLAKAIEASLYNTQFVNGVNGELTWHAKKTWNYYSYNDIWEYIMPGEIVDYPYLWAGLGCPAYYFYYSKPNPEEGLIRSYERLLTFFWATFACSHNTQTPRQRLQYLIDSIGLTSVFLKELNLYNDRLVPTAYMKRNNLPKLTQLKPALLLNQYESEYFAIVLEDVESDFKDQFSKATKAILSMAKPGGLSYIAQFFIVEAYLKIAKLLTLDRSYGQLPLTTYLNLNTLDVISNCQAVVRLLSLANDAYTILNWYDNKKNEFLEKNLLLWLANTPDQTLAYDSEYRLTNFDGN